jgi:hypothetical protein
MFTEPLEGQLQHLDQALTNSDHPLSYFLIHLFPPCLMGKQQQPILVIRKIRLGRKDHFIRGALRLRERLLPQAKRSLSEAVLDPQTFYLKQL